MCFRIDPKAKRWDTTKVYKAVHLYRDGIYSGPFRHARYQIGKRTRRSPGSTSIPSLGGGTATSGIYVCATQAIAKSQRGRFILECEVSPKGFLHTDGMGIATYASVVPVKVIDRLMR